jgi:hypothetical protein
MSFIDKLSSDFGLISIRKFDLEDLYLNINQCILILMKNNIILSRNLVLLLLKKITFFSKIQAVRAHESERVSWASQLSSCTNFSSIRPANNFWIPKL